MASMRMTSKVPDNEEDFESFQSADFETQPSYQNHRQKASQKMDDPIADMILKWY